MTDSDSRADRYTTMALGEEEPNPDATDTTHKTRDDGEEDVRTDAPTTQALGEEEAAGAMARKNPFGGY